MIKWIKNIFGIKKNKSTRDLLEEKRAALIEKNGVAWEVRRDGILMGYFKNPHRITKSFQDLKKSTVYDHISSTGTYKDDKYEIICQKS